MAKFRDKATVGRSAIVPFVPGESPQDRHYRRHKAAMDRLASVDAAICTRGYRIAIANEGQHWTISGDGSVWEWWPSSAKLVLNRNYRRGIHCHDTNQLIREILRER